MKPRPLAIIFTTTFILLALTTSSVLPLFLIGLLLLNYRLPTKEEQATIRHALENIGKPYQPQVLSDESSLYQFRHMKTSYLKSPTWDKKRRATLFRDNYTCQACDCSNLLLHVHHTKDYKLIPNEPLSSLVSLCDACHIHQHKVYGYPKTYQDYMTWDAPLISV